MSEASSIKKQEPDYGQNNRGGSWWADNKKMVLPVALILAIALIMFVLSSLAKRPKPIVQPDPIESIEPEPDGQPGFLPETSTSDEFILPSLGSLTDTDIEYLSFTDFYKKPDNDFKAKLNNYDLPLNIKIEGINYYDLSRRINLEPVVDDLNQNGFAILNNPWPKEANNFYAIYEKLDEEQIPFLVSSDFIAYYYQNTMKKIFKEIEGQVFYQNLWKINLDLYEQAKTRYESNLSNRGRVSDLVLEGQRMETAFFAVALELLQADPNQTAKAGTSDDSSKFTISESEKFSINFPSYIRDEVKREAALIKAARELNRSPNLLYSIDYKKFTVPVEYKGEAKLNNFYLATKWLNSVFPLYYKSDDCPDCLLDQEDWRISMVAASLISQDISDNPEIKTRWARIYKLMSFFQGLREEVDYVHFRDSLTDLFSEDYDIDELFSQTNPDSWANLENLQTKLLARDYPEIRGALNKHDLEERPRIGLKVLADYYWPNDYIFNKLSTPEVGAYQGQVPYPITACNYQGQITRCLGFSLDIINLLKPMEANQLFQDNTNYQNYFTALNNLNKEFNAHGLWPNSSYWATLINLQEYLNEEMNNFPSFTQSKAWEDKKLKTAIAIWVNLQLPLDNISLSPISSNTGLNNLGIYDENIYIEPNLSLVNEFIANNNMLLQMFEALQLKEEVGLSIQRARNLNEDLHLIKTLIEKELLGEKFNGKDIEAVTEFIRQYKLVGKIDLRDKVLQLNFDKRGRLNEDLSNLKLLALVHEIDGAKVISIGPIWDHRESK